MNTVSGSPVHVPLWWTVVNASWFGVLVGALIGIATTWLFYRHGKARPSIQTTSDSTLLVAPVQEAVADKLQIRFDETPVPQVTSSIVGLWNAGTTTFRAADIVLKDPLKLRLESGKILQATIEAVSRDVIGPVLTLISDREVVISFDFFEPQDAVTVRVLHSGLPGEIAFSGTLIGLPQGLQRFRPGSRTAFFERLIDRLFAVGAAALLGVVTTVVWAKGGWLKALLVPVGLIAIISCLIAPVLFLDWLGRRWSRKLPNIIISNSELRRRLDLEKAFPTGKSV